MFKNKRKGFTFIELIIVMLIIATFVLFAAPKFIGYIKRARVTEVKTNIKLIEDASQRYYIAYGDWPRESDIPFTKEEIKVYTDKVLDKTGLVIELDEYGNYYNIDYHKLNPYIKNIEDKTFYILQNPVGSVFYLGKPVNKNNITNPAEEGEIEEEIVMNIKYPLALDSDFTRLEDSTGYYYKYTGTAEYVAIPHIINGEKITSYYRMFEYSSIKGVESTNKNVINMSKMFYGTTSDILDVSALNTNEVTNINAMFYQSSAKDLNLSNFDTSKVTNMISLFAHSKATTINVSSFNTSNVTNMMYMFANSCVEILDLRNFNTSNVLGMLGMFSESKATTINVSSFDTSNVTTMHSMFNCSVATIIDVSSFNNSNVINMSWMFGSSTIKTIEFGSFNTSNVTLMSHMFYNSSVTTLDLSSFNMSKVTDFTNMFGLSKATKGYARSQTDINILNSASTMKPSTLIFKIK